MTRPTPKGVVVVLVAALMVAAGVSLAMRPHHDVPPAPALIAATVELSAQPPDVAVIDGGTLKLGDRVVRLFGVEPPPRSKPCGTHDDAGQDCAASAANALAGMLRDLPVACRITGMDSLGRPYAICQANGTELNSAMIAAGWARAVTAQPELKSAEQAARAAHRGVWAFE
jgi:endonuclease YncB( thermonuclease family)